MYLDEGNQSQGVVIQRLWMIENNGFVKSMNTSGNKRKLLHYGWQKMMRMKVVEVVLLLLLPQMTTITYIHWVWLCQRGHILTILCFFRTAPTTQLPLLPPPLPPPSHLVPSKKVFIEDDSDSTPLAIPVDWCLWYYLRKHLHGRGWRWRKCWHGPHCRFNPTMLWWKLVQRQVTRQDYSCVSQGYSLATIFHLHRIFEPLWTPLHLPSSTRTLPFPPHPHLQPQNTESNSPHSHTHPPTLTFPPPPHPPGGAAYSLLTRGLRVIGVDPEPDDRKHADIVINHPRFALGAYSYILIHISNHITPLTSL